MALLAPGHFLWCCDTAVYRCVYTTVLRNWRMVRLSVGDTSFEHGMDWLLSRIPEMVAWRYRNFFTCIVTLRHYSDVIMSTMASQITGVSIVCSAVSSGAYKKTSKFHVTGHCEGNHRWPVDSPHKGSVTRGMFQFDDAILHYQRRLKRFR